MLVDRSYGLKHIFAHLRVNLTGNGLAGRFDGYIRVSRLVEPRLGFRIFISKNPWSVGSGRIYKDLDDLISHCSAPS